EHVLRAAQADALGAELDRLLRVARVVGVGADGELARGVGPRHEATEVAGDGGLDGGDRFAVDLAGGAVEGDPVALGEGASAELEGTVVHPDLRAAGDAAGAHAAGDDRRVGGHAATGG